MPGGYPTMPFVFDNLYRDKHKLNTLARSWLEEHDYVYPNGKQAPRPGDSTFRSES